MISIASTVIPKRADPRRLDLLSDYLDEKCEEYIGICQELGSYKATWVSRSMSRGGAPRVRHIEGERILGM